MSERLTDEDLERLAQAAESVRLGDGLERARFGGRAALAVPSLITEVRALRAELAQARERVAKLESLVEDAVDLLAGEMGPTDERDFRARLGEAGYEVR